MTACLHTSRLHDCMTACLHTSYLHACMPHICWCIAKVDVHPRLDGASLDAQPTVASILQQPAVNHHLALLAAHFEEGAVVDCVLEMMSKEPEAFVDSMLETLASGRVRLLSESELASVPSSYALAYLCYCTLTASA